MMNNRTALRFLAAALLPLASACANDDGVAMGEAGREVVIKGNNLWAIDKFALEVCFHSDQWSPPQEADMRLVQETVEGAWSNIQGSVVAFRGWGICGGLGAEDIEIMLSPSATKGKSMVGEGSFPNTSISMTLPLATNTFEGKELGEDKVKHVYVHEFGHALGIYEEMEHLDYETCVREDGETFDATTKYADDVSFVDVGDEGVMNYCADVRRIADLELSDQEKMFAQLFYPSPDLVLGLACESGCFNGGNGLDGTQVFLREDGLLTDEYTARGAVFLREVSTPEGTEIVSDSWFATDGEKAMKWSATRNDDAGEFFEDIGVSYEFSGAALDPGQYYVSFFAEVSIDGVTPEPTGKREGWGGNFVNISNSKWTALAMAAF